MASSLAPGAPVGVAVLGAGVLGIDLASRVSRSELLSCVLVAGRGGSRGLELAARMGYMTSPEGIASVVARAAEIGVVFDVSDASEHSRHRAALADEDVLVVNLTPDPAGAMIVPAINPDVVDSSRHLNLITCGGQAAFPVLHAINQRGAIEYAEVVTTAATSTVGPATRRNMDEYLETTEVGARRLAGVPRAKVLASLSPAAPPPSFRVVVTAEFATAPDLELVRADIRRAANAVRDYARGYRVEACVADRSQVRVSIAVTATDGRLPRHAGNVEIINAAAVASAERYATVRAVVAHG